MATGISYNGKTVNVGDQVTILGGVTSITGTAPNTATVAVTPLGGGTSINVQAQDCAVVTPDATTGTALGKNGKLFSTGVVTSINGVVTAISGSGQSATLTVTTDASSTSVSVPAVAVYTNGA